ncbi:MAG TPA: hypothetical protein PLH60_08160 [Proteiniphilum sp.]|nr:hypothetical protein [Proteiniphilum sp.]HPJ50952.1 hypothetical protein [Proteiniphilum sp.]HPR20513.1 hypothetical protein [Proteiniphilum sp.]
MKNEKWFWLILLLLTGGLLMSGCAEVDEGEEEELLGASGPIYNMMTDLSDGKSGLYLTKWESPSNYGPFLVIAFEREECTFTFRESSSADPKTTTYSYEFAYPIVTLTPAKENEGVVIGTMISGRILKADEMSFKNLQENPVWIEVIRTK